MIPVALHDEARVRRYAPFSNWAHVNMFSNCTKKSSSSRSSALRISWIEATILWYVSYFILIYISWLKFQVQSNVLSMLTRMRQLALHPGLIPTNYLEELQADDTDDDTPKQVAVTPEEKARLQCLLVQAIEEYQECPICFGILNEPRITSCTHMFCLPWSVSRFELH